MGVIDLRRGGQPQAAPKTYVQDLGWKRQPGSDATVYIGYFRAPGIRYQGWIVHEKSGKLFFYILRPPLALLRETDFGGCFHHNNDDWWLVGFKPDDLPTDVGSGVAAIQKALTEAFQTRTAQRRGRV